MVKGVLSIYLAIAILSPTIQAAWVDDTSAVLAQQVLNATYAFLNRNATGSTCSAYIQADAASFERYQRDAAYQILQQRASALNATSKKANIRIQLDMIASATFALYTAEQYNDLSPDWTVTVEVTPPLRTPADIVFTAVTMPVDARYTDLSGTGSDPISPSDPTYRNGQPWFFFYRKDALAAANLTVPETWDDLIAAAARLNGTDFDRDGTPDYSVCINTKSWCTTSFYTLAGMLGPMLQTERTNGVFFDPVTMEPLVTTAAMERALTMFANLTRFNSPAASQYCRPFATPFVEGKCAITFNADQYQYSNAPWPNVTGRIGTSLFPGSPYAFNRTTRALQPCTPTLCPFAAFSNRTSRLINYTPLYTPYRNRFFLTSTATPTGRVGVTTFYQYITAATAASYVDPLLTALGYKAPAAPTVVPPAATNTTNTTIRPSPSPSPAPSARPGFNLAPLLEKGYNTADTISFLPMFVAGLISKNAMVDIAVPGAAYFRSVMAEAAVNATLPGANLTTITAAMNTSFYMLTTAFGNSSFFQQLYWTSIAYKPPPVVLPDVTITVLQPAQVLRGHDKNWKPGYTAAVVVPCAVFLLALLAALLFFRTRNSRRTLLGSVVPPGVGASTTLVVTDIQNSTVMWEQLPMDLMEQVLRVHHTTLRALLDRHSGYESATEGDSFILAFHCPSDALAFALDAQRALLEAPWPPELLEKFGEAAAVQAFTSSSHEATLSYTAKKLQSDSFASSKRITAPAKRSADGMPAPSDPSQTMPFSAGSAMAPSRRSIFACIAAAFGRCGASKDAAGKPGLQMDNLTDMDAATEADDISSETSIASPGKVLSSSFGWSLSQAWIQDDDELGTQPQAPHSILIWRGVRVRMGIHSGLTEPLHVSYNKASHRTQYSGDFASTAKAVGDVGHGGQVVLSGMAFSQLSAKDHSSSHAVLLMGEHVIKEGQAAMPIYQVAVPGAEPRLASFPQLRSKEQVLEGILSAPVGFVSVAFMNAVGVATLMHWDSEVTQQALSLYHREVSRLLAEHHGYIVEMVDGLVLAAFQRPESAVTWALSAQASLMHAEWPEKLLEHELCEPISATVALASEANGQVTVDTVSHLCSRGLRIKVGIDSGRAMDSIQSATGRMSYRGKVMNRAARIAGAASTGQVLCSQPAWAMAKSSQMIRRKSIIATSTGHHTLKGIAASLELMSCTYTVSTDTDEVSIADGYRRSSFVITAEPSPADIERLTELAAATEEQAAAAAE